MSERVQGSSYGHLTAVAAGAVVGGLAGWLLAPGFFWALLIGGSLTAGAIRVGYVMLSDNWHDDR